MIFNIIILFAAFSAFNLSIYFIVRALQTKQSLYFALASLVLSGSLLIYALEVSQLILDYPHLIWIHAPLLYLIGPLYFFSSSNKARKYAWLHLLPAALFMWWISPFYFQSAEEKLEAFLSVHQYPEEVQLLSYLYLVHIGFYSLASSINFKKKLSSISNMLSKRAFWIKFNFSKYLAWFSLLSFIACLILDLTQLYTLEVKKYTLLMIVLLLSAGQIFLSFTVYGENTRKINAAFKRKEKRDPFNELEIAFRKLVIEEKRYLSADISLEKLASELNCSKHQLSAFINQEYQLSFNNLFNKFRVQEFKRRAKSQESEKYTLLAIAKECGFSSNSSFHRTFKKEEGKTPRQYLNDNS